MEQDETKNSVFTFGINNAAQTAMRETAKWARFIAVFALVGLGLMVIGMGFLAFTGISVPEGMPDAYRYGYGAGRVLVCILLVTLYAFPIFYQYKFASALKQSLQTSNESQFAAAMVWQKKMYKFIGILLIVMFAIWVFAVVLGIIANAVN